MFKIERYYNDVILRNKKLLFSSYVIRSILLYIFLVSSSRFIGSIIRFKILGSYSYKIINNVYYGLYVIFICIFMSILSKKGWRYLRGGEIRFLRSLGFDTKELLVVLLSKYYIVFTLFGCSYFFLKWDVAKLDVVSVLYIFLGQINAFYIFFLASIIYNIIRNKLIVFLKDVSIIFLVIFFVNNTLSIFEERKFSYVNNRELMIEILNRLGSFNGIQRALDIICKLGILQIIMLFILTVLFYHTFYRNAFEIKIESRIKLRLPYVGIFRRINIKFKSNKNPLKSFIWRDTIIMMRRKTFLSIQVLFIILYTFISIKHKDTHINLTIVLMIGHIFLNSLLSQELFRLDTKFKRLYLCLPIHFNTFIIAKALCIAVLSLVTPLFFLIKLLLLNQIDINSFFIILGISTMVALILSFYFCSIIVAFYPNIHRTDLPLLISVLMLFFLPGISLILIYFGLKKGRSKWMRWEEIC